MNRTPMDPISRHALVAHPLAGSVPLTMSTREISELTGSTHDNVLKTVRRLVDGGVVSRTRPTQYIHPQNHQAYIEYYLNKRDSLVLVARLSPEFTAAIVDRWQDLEAGLVPTTLSGALRLAAEQAERIEQQQAALVAAAPKIEFVDRYASANGSQGFRQVCKLLKVNEAQFRLFLLDERIAYRLDGVLTPYQNHIDAGRFEVKTGVSTVSEHAFSQMRFTTKGITWVAGEWAKCQLRQSGAGE